VQRVVDAYRGARPLPAYSHKAELHLSEHVTDEGSIDESGADALVDAVREALVVAEDQGSEDLMAFATSALREAPNGPMVLERVKNETGVDLEVLSGPDEARLTFLAVRRWFGWSAGPLLVIDIGGGASLLVDRLLARGYTDLAVLDVSSTALEIARRRLGDEAPVRWLHEDLLSWQPERRYALWHDRAVFHFLTHATERATYLTTMRQALSDSGALILATFASPQQRPGAARDHAPTHHHHHHHHDDDQHGAHHLRLQASCIAIGLRGSWSAGHAEDVRGNEHFDHRGPEGETPAAFDLKAGVLDRRPSVPCRVTATGDQRPEGAIGDLLSA